MLQDLLLFSAGMIVGAMNAIAGGGLLIGFPVLLATGLPALNANAMTNVIVLPGQLASAFAYRKYLRRTPKKYLWLLLPCIIGAPLGTYLLLHTPGKRFEQIVPSLILFAVLLFIFQPFLHHHLHRHIKTRSKSVKPLVIIGLFLLPVAMYGGYFGAGMGFIMLAFLGFTKIHEIHQMNAVKNVAAAMMCIGSLILLGNSPLINWHIGLVMAAGTLAGGYLGARLAQRVSSHAIRVIVIIIGLSTAVYLGLRNY